MPQPRIKICGLSTAETLGAAIAAHAEYAGLVFHPASPRHVSLALAAQLGAQAAGRITRVGLFVDADDATIGAAVVAAGLEVLQLHGGESPARAAELHARFGIPVWKALAVAARSDLDGASDYAGAADLVLLDAKTPKGALPGGMGLSFDWALLDGWKAPLAWGLAGGLTPTNVAQAVAATGAGLVDTSSGVESAPGIKDAERISQFCRAARST